MRTPSVTLSLLCLSLCLASSAAAETRYISDQLVVTVRDSKSNNYTTLGTLLTASPVEILDEDKTFVKVRTEKGIEGYILKQYVTKALPKEIQIDRLKKQLAALETKLEQQQSDFQTASADANSSQATINQLTEELELTKRQLDTVSEEFAKLQTLSENVVSLSAERDQLLEENSQTISELKVLRDENANFHRSNMVQWFLAGGGVFFFGWLAGKLSRKKQKYSRF